MAQDSSAPANVNQEIDLDEIEIDILILAKNPNNMKQTCAFLTRRGWPAVAMGNISKAIEEIAEKRPDIVMVSFNHPSPAVLKLPDLIAQTFNLTCVGFVEGTDTASTSKLNTVKIRHKIFGTPSGPNFQRGIRRILAEKYDIKDDKAAPEERKGGGNVTIRGNKDEDGNDVIGDSENSIKQAHGTTVVQGGGAEGAGGMSGPGGVVVGGSGSAGGPRSGKKLNSLQQGGRGEGAGGSDDGAGDPSDTVGALLQGKSGRGLSGKSGSSNAHNGGANGGAGGSEGSDKESSADANSGVNSDDGTVGASLKGKSGNKLNAKMGAPGSDELETTDNQDLGQVMQMGVAGKKKGDKVAGTGGRRKLKEVTGEDKTQSTPGNMVLGENQGSRVERQAQEAVHKDLIGMLKQSLFGDHPEDTSPLGLLEKATEKALQQVCVVNPDIKPLALKTVSHVGVFPIDSEILPGFLVLGLEVPAAEDQKRFLKNCENNLIATFESMKVQAKIQPGFWLDVPETSFEQWVETAGAFNFKLAHKGNEVGVSYFQTEKNMPKASESHEKGMHTIDLADISTAEPVTFKAYLYLKENKKFYLYLRNGRQLQDEQKERLTTNKVSKIFLKEVDLENLRMYLSATYLKETIRTSKDAA